MLSSRLALENEASPTSTHSPSKEEYLNHAVPNTTPKPAKASATTSIPKYVARPTEQEMFNSSIATASNVRATVTGDTLTQFITYLKYYNSGVFELMYVGDDDIDGCFTSVVDDDQLDGYIDDGLCTGEFCIKSSGVYQVDQFMIVASYGGHEVEFSEELFNLVEMIAGQNNNAVERAARAAYDAVYAMVNDDELEADAAKQEAADALAEALACRDDTLDIALAA